MSTEYTPAEQRMMDGSAWADFCDSLKEAGALLDSEKAPQNPFDRAQGYRYLARMLKAGLDSFMEFGDPEFPNLRCPVHEYIKMGADNPDNRYENCPVDPQYDYRIYGQRNTVDYLGIGAVNNQYSTGGGMETDGFIDAREMEIGEDGTIELILSQRQQPGNWLRLGPNTNSINVRQTFQDRVNEIPAELKIERIGAGGARPTPLSPEKVDTALRRSVEFLKNTTGLFEGWIEGFIPTINEVAAADQGFCQAIGGDPNIYYFHSIWELADDEALVVEAKTIPECQTWNFVLQNWWMESLDYRYHNIHFNKHTAHYEDDGSVKIIVAHQQPNSPNWVETAGHDIGTMCWRWIGADEHPPINARVVKFSDL